MDTADLKRRAGIVNENEDFWTSGEASQHPQAIADNFINGNQKEAFRAIGGNVALFAQVAMNLGNSGGSEALMNFLQFASRRGQ